MQGGKKTNPLTSLYDKSIKGARCKTTKAISDGCL